jgi:predicted DNA-binding protein (UPF0251 family)
MSIPRLPRPDWVEELIAELRRIPHAVRLAKTVGAEQQKTQQMRESRAVLIEELKKAKDKITELENKVTEMEQLLIKHLQGRR